MIIHNAPQHTPAWFALRCGKPTSSEAGSLVTGAGSKSTSLSEYAAQLATEKYAGAPLDRFGGNKYTQRGAALEAEAITAYEFRTDQFVTPVGFVTDDLLRYGASTDGLVDKDGVVEVKCLVAKHHLQAIDYYARTGAAPPKYNPQTQMELFVTERSWTDLVFYHPSLPMLIVRHTPNIGFVAVLQQQITRVLQERDRLITVMESIQ